MKLHKHHEGNIAMHYWCSVCSCCGEGKKGQQPDALVCLCCRRDPFQRSFCSKQRRTCFSLTGSSHGWPFFSPTAEYGKILLELQEEKINKDPKNQVWSGSTTPLYLQSSSKILQLLPKTIRETLIRTQLALQGEWKLFFFFFNSVNEQIIYWYCGIWGWIPYVPSFTWEFLILYRKETLHEVAGVWSLRSTLQQAKILKCKINLTIIWQLRTATAADSRGKLQPKNFWAS